MLCTELNARVYAIFTPYFFLFFPEEWKVLTDVDKDHYFLTYGLNLENSSAFSYSS